jgi:formylglycine-generating enzyme required for sulfatase activity
VGKYPFTQELWREVLGGDPRSGKRAAADRPVESVSWTEAEDFLNRLCDRLEVARGSYRLLTEAEWEFACRAGTTAPTYGPLDEIAWYADNSRATVQPAGKKRANAYGLHDMLGNVWEWCSDWHGDYPTGPVTDPVGPRSGTYRVLRGGSWRSNAASCQSAYRSSDFPDYRLNSAGFRLARTVP